MVCSKAARPAGLSLGEAYVLDGGAKDGKARVQVLDPALEIKTTCLYSLGTPVTQRTRVTVTRTTAASTVAGVVFLVLLTHGLMTSLGWSQDRPGADTPEKANKDAHEPTAARRAAEQLVDTIQLEV
jgi:hypothetical protein